MFNTHFDQTLGGKNWKKKTIFVIMPFIKANDRDKQKLDHFFENVIKKYLESQTDFKYNYNVIRSGTSLIITDRIIEDLYKSDIVLCDLSGEYPNPNVMYELGIRFTLTNNPVILFRERNSKNNNVFNISGLYIEPYESNMYEPLQEFIKSKILEYEDPSNRYHSPVLKVLEMEPTIVEKIQERQFLYQISLLEAICEKQKKLYVASLYKILKDAFPDLPTNESEFLIYLTTETEKFKGFDFSSFNFSISGNIVVENLILSNDLNAFLPKDIAEKIKVYLIDYYTRFLSNSMMRQDVSIVEIGTFLANIYSLEKIARKIGRFLSTNDKNQLKSSPIT